MRFFFVLILFFLSNLLLAAPAKTVYSIVANTDWTNGNHWSLTSGGAACNCTPDISKDVIYIETTVQSAAGLQFGPSVYVFISSTAIFTITGNTEFGNGSIVEIDNGGSLIINGDLVNNNNSNQMIFDGTFQLNGSYTGGNGSSIIGSGCFSSTGTITTTGTGSIYGSTDDCATGTCSVCGSNPLPIELLSFNADLCTMEKEKVFISWTTATETNNDYFTLEKSFDGFSFELAGTIKGAGNSTLASTYNFTDYNLFDGPAYYRLKQTDFDGKYSYSKLIIAETNSSDKFTFTIFPNPSDGENIFVCSNTIKDTEGVSLVIYNSFGSLLYAEEIATINGSLSTTIKASEILLPGMYYIVISSSNQRYSRNITIK